jgi:hypothetical protein
MSVRSPIDGPRSSARTQRDRILAELRRRREIAPPGWISGADFRYPTCDGGPEIRNITPRVSELGKVHHIISERGCDGCARYRLSWDVGDDAAPIKQLANDAREAARGELEPDHETLALFDAAFELERNSERRRYEDWDGE